MNYETYNAKINELCELAYDGLAPDTLRKFDEQTIDQLVKAEFTALMRAESKRNPAFEEQVVKAAVHREVVAYFEEHRPRGEYSADAMFPIGESDWVKMPDATKEHLLAWSGLESGRDNLRYISERLLHWDETKHPTLADLERAFAEEAMNS